MHFQQGDNDDGKASVKASKIAQKIVEYQSLANKKNRRAEYLFIEGKKGKENFERDIGRYTDPIISRSA